MAKIHAKEQVICVSATSNNQRWWQQLDAQDIKHTKNVTQETTLLILGAGFSQQGTVAKDWGIPVIDETQAQQLLTDGVLSLADDIKPTDDLAQWIGSLRGHLDVSPSSDAWNAIIDAVDATDDAYMDVLVDYLLPQLRRWSVDEDVWWLPKVEPWAVTSRRGQLRVAPPAWVTAMVQGRYAQAHALVKVLDFGSMKLNAKAVVTALQNPYLTDITALYLSSKTNHTATFWKTVPTLDALTQLEVLGISEMKRVHANALKHLVNWTPFRTLHVAFSYSRFEEDALIALFEAFEHVEVISLDMIREPILGALNATYSTPRLQRLDVCMSGLNNAEMRLIDELERTIPTLRLITQSNAELDQLGQALNRNWSHVDTLDLSGAWPAIDALYEPASFKANHDEFARALLEHLPSSLIARTVQCIKLGRWWSTELVEALEMRASCAIER